MPIAPRELIDQEELLASSPLFSSLTMKQYGQIRNHITTARLKENEILFHRGDAFHSFYLVITGKIGLFRVSLSGQEKIIELATRGGAFAEALMFNENPIYPVSARVMEDAHVFKINATHFRNMLLTSPEACMSILANVSCRLHTLVDEIDNLSLLNGRNRLSVFLLDRALTNGTEFELDIPKHAIASMLSVKPETLSRLFKELITNEIIEVNEQHIRVFDLDGLRKFSGIYS